MKPALHDHVKAWLEGGGRRRRRRERRGRGRRREKEGEGGGGRGRRRNPGCLKDEIGIFFLPSKIADLGHLSILCVHVE